MTMSKNDQTKLWSSIKDAKLNEFEETRDQLEHSSETAAKSHAIRLLIVSPTNNTRQDLESISLEDSKTLNLETFFKQKRPMMDLNGAKVLIQGISPSWDTPLDWLIANCSYPDLFLYICIHLAADTVIE